MQCQLLSSAVPEKPRSSTVLARPLGFFDIHSLAKYQKKRDPLKTLKIFRKVSQCRKNEGGPL